MISNGFAKSRVLALKCSVTLSKYVLQMNWLTTISFYFLENTLLPMETYSFISYSILIRFLLSLLSFVFISTTFTTSFSPIEVKLGIFVSSFNSPQKCNLSIAHGRYLGVFLDFFVTSEYHSIYDVFDDTLKQTAQ